jgi:hypothetical protein
MSKRWAASDFLNAALKSGRPAADISFRTRKARVLVDGDAAGPLPLAERACCVFYGHRVRLVLRWPPIYHSPVLQAETKTAPDLPDFRSDITAHPYP